MSRPDRNACRLRPAALADARRILDWRNRPRIRAVMFTTGEIDWDGHCAWLARTIESPSAHAFIFEQDGRPLGYVKLDDLGEGRFTWGFYIGEEDAPTGSGGRMLFLALEAGFGPLGARVLEAEVKPDNVASVRLHEKLGFIRMVPEKEGALHFELARDGWQDRRIALSEALFLTLTESKD